MSKQDLVQALNPRTRTVATAIANARAARRGAPAVANVLAILPPGIFSDVVDDARAAIDALDDQDLAAAKTSASRLTTSYVDAMRLELGASTLLVLIRDRAARPAAAFSAAGAGTQTLNSENAQELWQLVADFVRALAGQPPLPTQPEPKP